MSGCNCQRIVHEAGCSERPEPACPALEETPGTLTPEVLSRALDELWNGCRIAPEPIPDEMHPLTIWRTPERLWGLPVISDEAEERDRCEWIAGVKNRLGLVTAGDCSCTDAGGGVRITNSCDLHNPFTGLLVEQPVQFTGLLSVLEAGEPPSA